MKSEVWPNTASGLHESLDRVPTRAHEAANARIIAPVRQAKNGTESIGDGTSSARTALRDPPTAMSTTAAIASRRCTQPSALRCSQTSHPTYAPAKTYATVGKIEKTPKLPTGLT